MSEVHKFTSGDGKFELSVKADFLKTCPNPHEVNIKDLLITHKVNQFFHNPSGPAITRVRDKFMEYWINGERLNEEEGKRIAHGFNFNNKLMDEIKIEDTPVKETE